MKYNQNTKILQVTEETMIVGVDIASEIHYARAFDNRGVEIGKLLKFHNDAGRLLSVHNMDQGYF